MRCQSTTRPVKPMKKKSPPSTVFHSLEGFFISAYVSLNIILYTETEQKLADDWMTSSQVICTVTLGTMGIEMLVTRPRSTGLNVILYTETQTKKWLMTDKWESNHTENGGGGEPLTLYYTIYLFIYLVQYAVNNTL